MSPPADPTERPEDPLASKHVETEKKRLALNEAMFREINERLESRLPSAGETISILCECASRDCAERITLTTDEYSEVRSDPRQFAVVPGHECVNIESVVVQTDRYEVVRKTGVAGDFAALLEPSVERSDRTAGR